MNTPSRRAVIRGAAAAAPAIGKSFEQGSPNDRVNVAVVGFHGRGRGHITGFAKVPNVRIAALCDADERLFTGGVALVEKLQGHKPATEFDIRRLLERKDIDAVSIASPDYWHALMTNPDKEAIVGDAEANAMITRKYREPYVLPEKV
ncbi:MAG: hypothetical protein HY820_42170 [Acidobacteria bacterium]|nr:hypothetical protein [Acidobacteriota bacterium]